MLRGKNADAVESYFKTRAWIIAEHHYILSTLRYFDISAHQKGLNDQIKALCFVNALGCQAREYFCANLNKHTPFDGFEHLMRVQYKSKAQKLRVQAEMETLDFSILLYAVTSRTALSAYISWSIISTPEPFGLI